MADLHSKILDAPPPPGVQILSISCSFWENLAKSYVGAPWRVGAPSSGKSWIRHCLLLKALHRAIFPLIFNFFQSPGHVLLASRLRLCIAKLQNLAGPQALDKYLDPHLSNFFCLCQNNYFIFILNMIALSIFSSQRKRLEK